LRDDGVALTAALACTGCGLCDVVCPASLSPRTLVVDVRDRLRQLDANVNANVNANANASSNGHAHALDVALLTLRLGLAEFDRPPTVRL
jgi:Na+-translocating ferredoxin:NAD+ oxidoreductase RnfC subunit